MPRSRPGLAASVTAALALGTALGLAAPGTVASASPTSPSADSLRGDLPAARLARSMFGLSGALRVAIVDPAQPLELPLVWDGAAPAPVAYEWSPLPGTRPARGEGLLGAPVGSGPRLLGTPVSAAGPAGEPFAGGALSAPAGSGAWRLHLRGEGWSQEVGDLTVLTRVPFAAKRGGFVNGYHMGSWHTEGSDRDDRYAPPAGFIEVTPENQDLQVSEHFRLRNFLTKNQFSVWPKYVALDLRLIDKLELVMQELRAMGIRADHMAVMSGFRTPAYNGPGEGGRAKLSRHTYGDAADVWVDSDQDNYIDDLNQDGRRDVRDAEVMLRAVDRVEAKYPELVGGAGVYLDNGARGPFIHIDVRGSRSRW
ncbi:MAG TPA: D-Ala-D-Ala carboxypeptidase family metallohydrolase [Longimicrobiaceae bacterium]|nr:D-Ala-D-Ala carboxypeptidase family metallohydrolase [Longimicrobiaceae bacterium]